jgi:3-oxoacyl-[acyl-carrier protein] reductase
MDLGLTGRTAVVCASTGGLGAGVARALGKEGAHVVVSGRRESEAKALAASLPSSIGVAVDLLADDGPETLLAAATAAYGAVDILVLNGPGPAPAPAHAMAWADAQTAVDMLLRPQLTLVGATLPGMRERSWGRVLAVGSSGVVSPLPNLAASPVARVLTVPVLEGSMRGRVASFTA